MSVVAFMLRRSLVSILRGRTLAADHVHDSIIDPIDMMAENAAHPFICIAVEESVGEGFGGSRGFGQSEKRMIDIVIEIGIGTVATVTVPSRDGTPDSEGQVAVLELQMTDMGEEATLDIITRQIERQFVAPGTDGWGLVLSRLISRIEKVQTRRGLKAEGQERAAFRQIVITASVLQEPPIGITTRKPGEPQIGEALPDTWRHALATLEADADPAVARLAGAFRAVIIGENIDPATLPFSGWGVGPDAAKTVQLAPLPNAELRPTLTEARTEFDGPTE